MVIFTIFPLVIFFEFFFLKITLRKEQLYPLYYFFPFLAIFLRIYVFLSLPVADFLLRIAFATRRKVRRSHLRSLWETLPNRIALTVQTVPGKISPKKEIDKPRKESEITEKK